MLHIGLFSRVMNEHCANYRGIYRSSELIDYYDQLPLKNDIDWMFSNSHDGNHKALNQESLNGVTALYQKLTRFGWQGDILIFGDPGSPLDSLPVERLGTDICGDGVYYSPLGDGFLSSYEPRYSFYQSLSYHDYAAFSRDINPNGLFAHVDIANQFAAYCNQISQVDSHAIETEANWHAIAVYALQASA